MRSNWVPQFCRLSRQRLHSSHTSQKKPKKQDPNTCWEMRACKHEHGTRRSKPPVFGTARYRDGTTHIVLEPLDFIARLAALVPPRGCT
jgi:hypothetical protein